MSRLAAWYAGLNSREQRAVLLGLSAGVAFLLARFLILPIMDHRDSLLVEIGEKQQTLSKQQRIVRKRADYEQKASRAQALETRIDGRLLPGVKPELATAELQSLLKSYAREHDIDVDRITPREAKPLGPYMEISIEAPFYCTTRGLRDLLYDIETADRFLFIRELEVRVPNPKKPDRLRVSLETSGFIHSAEPQAEEDLKRAE